MDRLVVLPESTAYSVEEGAGYLSVELDGGLSRIRADKLNPSKRVQCTWAVGPADYAYLQAFRRRFERTGAQFLIELLSDYAELNDYYAHIVPSTWNLNEQRGLRYVVSAVLEIVSVSVPSALVDDYLVEFRDDYADLAHTLARIDRIALVHIDI